MPTLRRRSPVTDEQIVEHYKQCLSAKQTAKALGIGSSTVERILLKFDVERPGIEAWRANRTIYRACEIEMRADYEAGATYEQLISKYGPGSVWSVKEALKRAGTVMRDNPAREENDQEVERVRELSAQGLGQKLIAKELGRSQSFVTRLMRRYDIPTKRNEGKDHAAWKGGRWVDSHGYVRVLIPFDDPLFAGMHLSDNYIPEHRLVMARHIGRPLRRSETVHHINGNNSDNRIENLQLRQGRHGKHTSWRCRACGSYDIEPVEIEEAPAADNDASTSLFE